RLSPLSCCRAGGDDAAPTPVAAPCAHLGALRGLMGWWASCPRSMGGRGTCAQCSIARARCVERKKISVSDEDILLGIALTVALATGSQVLANKLRVPALIVLLPVGFTAGALTDVIHPGRLVGPDFPALVSLSVAVILYDAGLGLNMRNLTGATRSAVVRL